MTDRPLEQATLEALQDMLTAGDPPAMDPETWRAMLRRTFEAGDAELFGDVSGEELIPPEWPVPTETSTVGPIGDEEATTDVAGGGEWPVGGDAWSDHDPADDGPRWHDEPESDGGDLS